MTVSGMPAGSMPHICNARLILAISAILLFGAACQKEPVTVSPPPALPRSAAPSAPPAQTAAAMDAPPSPAPSTDGAGAVTGGAGDGGVARIPDPKPAIVGEGTLGQLDKSSPQGPAPSAMKDWADTLMYRVKVDSLAACRPKRSTEPIADGDPPRELVGAFVHVGSKVGEFAVNPRDFVLQRGGNVVQANLPAKDAVPGCGPALAMTRLMPLKQTQGYVVFAVPPSFKEAKEPVLLGFRPTRWGGAPRTDVALPDCLASCPPGATAGKKTAAAGGTAAKRSPAAPKPASGRGGDAAQ